MIEKILPSTKTRLRILDLVYSSDGINLTHLAKRAKTSANITISYVNTLVRFNILKEERLGGKKKAHIRIIRPNLKEDLSIHIFSLIEIEKKIGLLEKYSWLKPFMSQLTEIFSKDVDFCLIYGSFARFSADKESDLDMWIVGKISQETKTRISEIFSTFSREYSIKVETQSSFKKKISDPIHQNILKDHVIIYNGSGFIKALSGADIR